ncbi:UNVERIFIED_CONTAM: hypothetical protein FKN15_017250 [Acipenser sinensis]
MLDTQLNKEVPVLEAQQAKGRSSTSYDSETNGPQYPARPCARSTAAERSGQGRGAAKNLRTVFLPAVQRHRFRIFLRLRCELNQATEPRPQQQKSHQQ